jgi:hypothetical protein
VSLQGSSLGGGDVVLTRIDAYDVEVTGELPLLLVATSTGPARSPRSRPYSLKRA